MFLSLSSFFLNSYYNCMLNISHFVTLICKKEQRFDFYYSMQSNDKLLLIELLFNNARVEQDD